MHPDSRPPKQIRPTWPSRFMRRAIFRFLPAFVALILLPPIAFASPPDQPWIAGIYDGADGDDIVSLVYDTAAAHAADGAHITARPCLRKLAPESIAWGVSSHRFARNPRAPPVRGSAIFTRVLRCSPRCSSTASGTDPPLTAKPKQLARHAPAPLEESVPLRSYPAKEEGS